MATQRGIDAVKRDPKGFARIQWDTWAPQGWFSETEFAATAKSCDNPDWPAITLHSYQVRWGEADKDPRYGELDERVHTSKSISVPTLMIQGEADGVTLAASTAGKDKYFTGGYRREAPEAVSALLLDFLSG